MIYLLMITAILLAVPFFALITSEKKSLFVINILYLACGVMLLSLPAGLFLGKAFYFLTHS